MGGRLEREGINIYLWLIHIVVQEKTIQHCQVIKNKLKKKRIHSQKNITCSISPSKKSNWGSRKGIDYHKQPNKDFNSKWLLLGTKATKVPSTGEDVLRFHVKLLCNSQHYNQLWIERTVMYFNTIAKQAWTKWFYKFAKNSNCSMSVPWASHLTFSACVWNLGFLTRLWG